MKYYRESGRLSKRGILILKLNSRSASKGIAGKLSGRGLQRNYRHYRVWYFFSTALHKFANKAKEIFAATARRVRNVHAVSKVVAHLKTL